MRTSEDGSNLLFRFNASRELADAGIKAELVGRRTVRLMRSGRMLGIWQAGTGTYNWYPAGQTRPQASVFSVEDAARHSSRTFSFN